MHCIALAVLLWTLYCSSAPSVLHVSFFSGRLKVLDYLINELGVDGVAREKGGLSSVHAATQGGHPTTVKVTPTLTLTHPHAHLHTHTCTPTHAYTHSTQWLVNKLGISYILDKTYDGATPLHMAAGEHTHTPELTTAM